jgi:hypothetical protein
MRLNYMDRNPYYIAVDTVPRFGCSPPEVREPSKFGRPFAPAFLLPKRQGIAGTPRQVRTGLSNFTISFAERQMSHGSGIYGRHLAANKMIGE